MNFKEQLRIAVLMTVVTTVLLGIAYPLAITGLAQLLFHDQANGQILTRSGTPVGSRIIAQPFSGAQYFHPRPSAAGNGYDPTSSGGSYYGPTNAKLVQRVAGDVAALQKENPGASVPIDLVTTSGSGLDPDITPAAAEFQIPRVARARGMSEQAVRDVLAQHIRERTLGLLGEPRINVLELNLALDGHVSQN